MGCEISFWFVIIVKILRLKTKDCGVGVKTSKRWEELHNLTKLNNKIQTVKYFLRAGKSEISFSYTYIFTGSVKSFRINFSS